VHPIAAAVGKAVERRRRECGYSWRTLGARSGVSANTVRNVERGARSARIDIVAMIARGLGTRLWRLIREAEVGE
jgi:transcriptional regulator with XRE-family HTH domain